MKRILENDGIRICIYKQQLNVDNVSKFNDLTYHPRDRSKCFYQGGFFIPLDTIDFESGDHKRTWERFEKAATMFRAYLVEKMREIERETTE